MLPPVNTDLVVVELDDPCDPCYNNPYVRGSMRDRQKGVIAGRQFSKGDVVCFYEGALITMVRAVVPGLAAAGWCNGCGVLLT